MGGRDIAERMLLKPKKTPANYQFQEKKSEKSPPYSGKGLVNGKEVRAAMWKNKSKDGKIYLKLKFSDPQDMGTREAPPRDEDFDF